jgi:poly(3-hydroxybutyrate) depolymerase
MALSPFILVLLVGAFSQSLNSYNVDINETTISGLSAGGFFAVQFHFAYSSYIKGAGIFAGGPYLCSGGEMEAALTTCMSYPMMLSVSSLESKTKSLASSGSIDDTSNLSGSRVYIYSGQNDNTVKTPVVKAAA